PLLDASSVASDTSRLATLANLQKAGQQFEAIFVQMMLKSMRATHLADDIFGSKAGDTFRDMQDQKIAQTMAAHQPLGIGKAMSDFLAKS
ncbi:rod-binding protein, partial [Campylobacter coli]|uniref:rod-binding protein n=1 Tax=Campylobacter coli TaxID=195 RepID=UPI003F7CB523